MARRKRTGTKCTSTYKSFVRQNLGKEIRKAGSAKAGMKALARKWKQCKSK